MSVINQYQVVIPGQLITAALWNGMELNIIDNGLVPSGIEDYSATESQFHVQEDPYPGGAVSLATSLQGELARLRYQISLITGEATWEIDPDSSLASINADITAAESAITTAQSDIVALEAISVPFPAGTVALFYQAAAPTGWTKVTTHNDKAIRIVSGSGGGSGGTSAFSSGLAHTHTVTAHSHTISHRHATPVENGGNFPASSADWGQGSESISLTALDIGYGFGGGAGTYTFLKTRDSDTASSGSTALTTASTSPVFQYIDVILASRNN